MPAVLRASGKEFAMRNVRLFYKKLGKMKFVSHLDMNRFIIKIIRMSKIPVWYSEGFNPHPYITFALPLSLGFESDYDIIDFRLDDDDFKNEEVIKSLSPLLPEGIELVFCSDPIMKTSEIAYADFLVDFGSDISGLKASLENFLAEETIMAEKKSKKGIKTVNLKEYLKDYRVGDTSLLLTLAAGGSNNLNPKLLLDSFEKNSSESLPAYSVMRQKLYNSDMDLFK